MAGAATGGAERGTVGRMGLSHGVGRPDAMTEMEVGRTSAVHQLCRECRTAHRRFLHPTQFAPSCLTHCTDWEHLTVRLDAATLQLQVGAA